ncbi:MAG: Biotin carboxyl carrier protein of acetyl-CoA carboxylase [Chlamydiota bacterium]|jgi:acetyl-CoA carboxylase biotin carboxyl carrier protein
MDIKQIKELIATMERAGIKKLTLKMKGGEEIHLERETQTPDVATPPSFYPPVYAHAPAREPEPKKVEAAAPKESSGKHITAPLVGTFYATPSPDAPAFVKVGDKVSEGTVVCIIEAMKVMNEVKAGMSGTVAEVCVDNAHPVEFGSKLFRIV